jgi:hypothetical protein
MRRRLAAISLTGRETTEQRIERKEFHRRRIFKIGVGEAICQRRKNLHGKNDERVLDLGPKGQDLRTFEDCHFEDKHWPARSSPSRDQVRISVCGFSNWQTQ